MLCALPFRPSGLVRGGSRLAAAAAGGDGFLAVARAVVWVEGLGAAGRGAGTGATFAAGFSAGLAAGAVAVGAWLGAGVASGEQAAAAGERAAERLVADGVTQATVVAFEDPRWPESRRRVEATLDAVERRCGKVEVRLRVFEEGGVAPSLEKAMPRLARVGRIDLFVAGDPASTPVALEAARRMGLDVSATLVGISDDPALLAAATQSARTFLVGYERAKCAAAILDGIDGLLAAPAPSADGAAAPQWPVAATIHGPALNAAPAGGP